LPLSKRAAQVINTLALFFLAMAAANKKGVLKLQRAFKDKQLIAILPDQYPGEKDSVVSSFFGHNAQTMTLLCIPKQDLGTRYR
jgi:KDO2-lipid IV(A) lauroyltransferase